jgi:hypothetical protein
MYWHWHQQVPLKMLIVFVIIVDDEYYFHFHVYLNCQFVDFYLLVEPYNFECSRCGDVYSTGKDKQNKSHTYSID